MQKPRSILCFASRFRLLMAGGVALGLGVPVATTSPASATASKATPAAASLALGPPLYRGKLTAKKKGSKCRRGCPTTCKTLTLTPSQYQLHCNARGYSGLVIFSGKRCKKAGKKIHCWFKGKQLTFRGSKTK